MRKLAFALVLCVAGTVLAAATSVYNFTLKSIDGKPVSLSEYHGKVLMLVNVASKCGFTPQYSALESLCAGLRSFRGLADAGLLKALERQLPPAASRALNEVAPVSLQPSNIRRNM